ncbi:pupal cuticle protein 20-like [Anthonomus grandis grandis]|uniref:pupal cuticle protein 20-like n=1 Tax=Anthonomus grandis grandis TaxID=2921223 RepID=UPI0021651B76|nr:pupal cuticle protein 20-like [Anthonomus grandis grandis]
MRVYILASLLSVASCARLDNLSYLPPTQGSQLSINQRNTAGFDSHSSGSFAAGGFSGHSSSFGATQSQSHAATSKQIPILKFASDNNGDGSYNFNYETENRISAEEQGDARGDGTKARGSFSYSDADGQQVSISYTADENGFVPQGAHIPTPPAIPEAILKGLEESAAAEARGIFDDGSYHGEGLAESQFHGEGLSEGQYRGEGLDAASYKSGSASGSSFDSSSFSSSGSNAFAGKAANNGGYRY